MYQTVGHHAIELYAEAMSLPLYRRAIQGSSKEVGKYYSPTADDEVEDLYELLKMVKKETNAEAVSVGAIMSDYQRVRVENVCQRLGLTSLAYLWRRNQQILLKEMIDCRVEAIIIKVAALGLDPKQHIGKSLADIYPHMLKMEKQFGLNVCGEGGEFETFTLDCPLFHKKLVVDETEMVIHSEDAFAPVGYLNLTKIHLEDKQTETSFKQDFCSLPMTRGCNVVSELFNDEECNQIKQHLSTKDVETNPVIKHEYEGDVIVQSRVCSRWFSVSGLVGRLHSEERIEDITKAVMVKLKDTIEELGQKMSSLISVCLYVHDMSHFAKINAAYKTYFSINPPVRICVEAANPSNMILLMDCMGSVSDTTVTENTPSPDAKDTMHVQSMSHWAAANIGPYSQAVHVHKRIYVAGQIALCPASLTILDSLGIVGECRLSLRHLSRILAAMHSGCNLSHVSLVICYVTTKSYIETAQQEWLKALEDHKGEDHKPLLEFVIIPRLPRSALVEWQAHAYTGEEALTDGHFSVSLESTTISIDYCFNIEEFYFASRTSVCSQERTSVTYEQSLQEVVKLYSQVLRNHQLSWEAVPLLRIFYPVCLCQYTSIASAISSALESLSSPTPGFSLVPVTSLSREDCIFSVCS